MTKQTKSSGIRSIDLELPMLHPAQLKIKSESERFNVVDCGRRWGKSLLGEDVATHPILKSLPVGWFAPTFKVLDAAFDDFLRVLEPVIKSSDKTKRVVHFKTGGILECWSFEQKNVARSRKYALVVIDECGLITNLIDRFNKEIRPTLSDYRGSAWFLGTPDGKGDFYELFERGNNASQEKRKNWKSWCMPTSTNPHILPEEIEDAKRDLPESIFMQEYEGSFLEGKTTFVPASWLEACTTYDNLHALRGFESGRTPIVVGIDAGYSSDYFAISVVYRDWSNGMYAPDAGTVAVVFEKVFEPAELRDPTTGKPDFQKPMEYVLELSQTQNVIAFVYDPYQLVHFAGEAQKKVRTGYFLEFNQGNQRALADSMLRQRIQDIKFRLSASLHGNIRQHILNAGCKLEASAEQKLSSKIRMIKTDDKKKIDLAVATSMAVYVAIEEYNI